MKRWVGVLILLAAASPAAQESAVVPPDTRINVRLTHDLSSKKAKVGESVYVRCVAAVRSIDGSVLIPQDAQLKGRITDAAPLHKEQSAKLSFVITEATWGDRKIPLNAYMFGRFRTVGRAVSIVELGGETPRASIYGGGTSRGLPQVSLVVSSDPGIGPELISSAKNIELEAGTVFQIRNMAPNSGNQAAPRPAK